MERALRHLNEQYLPGVLCNRASNKTLDVRISYDLAIASTELIYLNACKIVDFKLQLVQVITKLMSVWSCIAML